MERSVYNTQSWRDLPRELCAVSELLGEIAGPCRGLIAHHHTDPSDPDSRTVQVCNRHHQMLHTVLRASVPRRKTCPHHHRSRESREACERRLNQAA